MRSRVPVVATVVVVAAVLLMLRLGIWQLHRAKENEQLMAQYASASKLPPITYPTVLSNGPLPLFRWATGFCHGIIGEREIAGRNRAGDIGWAHIIDCRAPGGGPGMSVEIGWSRNPNAKMNWPGGLVSGVIVPDREHRIRLVAAGAPPGLEPPGLPSVETAVPVTPARNRLYALQWFSFAAIALIIYGLAMRKRLRERPKT